MSDTKNTALNIKQEFFKYVSLSILGLIGISCYILIDTYFISKGEGNLGLTALNVAIPAFYVMNAIGLMIGIGGATKYSITKKSEIFTHALIISVIFSIIFFMAGVFFARNISVLLGADDNVIDITASYLRVLLCFSPAFMLNNLFMAFIRNDNKPHLVTVAMSLGSLFNIIFDYIFIFPLGLGMFGAALATGFSPAISLLIMSLHKIKKQNSFHIVSVKPSLSAFWQISAPGMSTFITELAN
ncbi:MAG: polysaccharide biosynthesis C-terminal domain-containing protein, partial [Lachnospiraceae bacterium]|nr:polysaccharide biosynthesis C-terminal domain-containing protein [Lachnospiraceae bacterium]